MGTKVLEGLSWKFGFEDVVSSGPEQAYFVCGPV